MAQDTMLYWLARAAKEAREAAGRKQVHVAASANKDQSTIYRFEQGLGWPRETDLFVAAYADDLDIEPIQLWEKALEMWREAGRQASVAELTSRRAGAAAEAADLAELGSLAEAAERDARPARRRSTARQDRQRKR